MWAIGGSTLNWSTIFFCHAILRFILSSWFAGLLKTNTIMFGESGGRGLFPMFSLMNHSCRLESSTYIHSMLKCTVHTFFFFKILSINLLNHVVSGPTLSTHSTPRKSKILQKLHLSFICNLIQNEYGLVRCLGIYIQQWFFMCIIFYWSVSLTNVLGHLLPFISHGM